MDYRHPQPVFRAPGREKGQDAICLLARSHLETAVDRHGFCPRTDGVFADNLPDLFTHNVSFQPYERKAADILALDSIDDLVIVLELKGPKTTGCFIVLGYETGLHLMSMAYSAMDNNGIPTYEFATEEGQGEKYSRYVFWDTDYDTTLAALVALE